MPLYKRPGSPYWQTRFRIAGRKVRCSTDTTERAAAEEFEEQLRRRYWRQIKLGEKHYTWDQAVERYTAENSHLRGWERSVRALKWLNRLLKGAPLAEIDSANIAKLREIRRRQVGAATVNRDFAELRAILNRAATDWKMLDAAPKVPMYRLQKVEPRWEPRERIHALLGQLPPHSRDMAILACATGMRRSEITKLKRAHVDLKRATAFVPATNAKANNSRVVPLNSDALVVLAKWIGHPEHHLVYVFSFRGRAPIKQICTKAWRDACAASGLPGFRFHDLRHTWASWQVQAETPLKHLQELGGWATMDMVMRYAHLAPGHLAQYAERSALGPAPEPEGAQKVAHSEIAEKRRA
jgi:integrase